MRFQTNFSTSHATVDIITHACDTGITNNNQLLLWFVFFSGLLKTLSTRSTIKFLKLNQATTVFADMLLI